MSGLVRYEVAGAVATITLDRPEALNAWTPELARELLVRVREAAADEGVRAVLVTGAGRAFSAGADVKNPRELTGDGHPDLSTRLRTIYNPIVVTVREMPKPVVAAINGPAVGLGAALALACDQLVMADDAYLLLAFVKLGVIPDGGVLGHLAARIGTGRTARLAMLGERLPADRALAWGAVDEVVPAAELRAAARSLVARLAAGPTVALGNIKRALRHAGEAGLTDQLEFEAQVQQEHGPTHDYAEAVRAFKEKRPPEFEGR